MEVSGDDASVVVKLPKDATGTVTITVDGKTYSAEVIDGEARFDIPGLDVGIVRVYLTGNNSYEELANILIPNFASDSILCCKHFLENVNETRNAVNDVRKTVNLSSKTAVNHIRK